jgi:hypothetical protein
MPRRTLRRTVRIAGRCTPGTRKGKPEFDGRQEERGLDAGKGGCHDTAMAGSRTSMAGVATFVTLLLAPIQAPAAETVPLDKRLEDPVGEDPTRPRPEMLLRYEFRNEPGRAPDTVHAFLFEGITRVPINERWAGRLRLDMPLVLTNLPSDDDSGDAWRFGSGDLLTEAAAIHYPNERWALAAGAQVLFPTASRDVIGGDSWIVGPGAVARAMLPELSPDSFVAPHLFYAVDTGGDRMREHVSELHVQPQLHWAPTPTVFFELFPAADIVVNLTAAGSRGRLFFPFNALAGILLTPKIVTSLEIGVPIVKDYPLYDFKLQAAVGYFFD